MIEIMVKCPNCKVWGSKLMECNYCPICGFYFTKEIKEKEKKRCLLRDVGYFVFNGYFNTLYCIIMHWMIESVDNRLEHFKKENIYDASNMKLVLE